MKILFDQGTPVPLRRHLHPHTVDTLAERGWSDFENGKLLDQAEAEGYEILITTDQNLKYQQDLGHRSIRILVLKTTSWPRIRKEVDRVPEAVDRLDAGSYSEIEF